MTSTGLERIRREAEPYLYAAFVSIRTAVQLLEKHPLRSAQAMDGFWTFIEQYYDHIASYTGFSCKKGCGACCKDNPHGISGIEFERILSVTKTRTDAEELKSTLADMSMRYQRLKANDPNPQIAWKRKGIHCIFYKEGSCSIYDVRPLACRSFFALTPAPLCDTNHPNHEDSQNPQFVGSQEFHQTLLDFSAKRGLTLPDDLISGLNELWNRRRK
ncbi:MAG: YkgJ family cysteine cluster protein [Myxococcota bacterium]|nr:YkgJ family cysteine cluster protein [Myxococcota bacterium]